MADNEGFGGVSRESTSDEIVPTGRNCWAIDTLIEEVTALFKTEVETYNPSRFNANLTVVFRPEKQEREDMGAVMPSLEEDPRVESVYFTADDSKITVRFYPDPILQDTRDPFVLADAVMGLDRELTPDDLTPLAADLSSGEGFTEGSL